MMKSSGATIRVGIAAALAAGGLLVGASGAAAATPVTTADTRATSGPGKSAGCAGAGLEGEAFGLGSEGLKGEYKSYSKGQIGKDSAVNITAKPDNGFITGVVVENAVGNNTYRAGVTPNRLKDYPFKDLVGPTTKGSKKLGPLTGWYVCVSDTDKNIGSTPKGVDNAPPIMNDTTVIPTPVYEQFPQLPRI